MAYLQVDLHKLH